MYLCSEKSKIYVMETTKRRRATVRLPEYAMADIQNQAKRQNRSVNSILAMYILDGLYHEPNETTLAAMAECESEAELDDFDPRSLDAYIEYYEKEDTKAVHTI